MLHVLDFFPVSRGLLQLLQDHARRSGHNGRRGNAVNDRQAHSHLNALPIHRSLLDVLACTQIVECAGDSWVEGVGVDRLRPRCRMTYRLSWVRDPRDPAWGPGQRQSQSRRPRPS